MASDNPAFTPVITAKFLACAKGPPARACRTEPRQFHVNDRVCVRLPSVGRVPFPFPWCDCSIGTSNPREPHDASTHRSLGWIGRVGDFLRRVRIYLRDHAHHPADGAALDRPAERHGRDLHVVRLSVHPLFESGRELLTTIRQPLVWRHPAPPPTPWVRSKASLSRCRRCPSDCPGLFHEEPGTLRVGSFE
eukprot:scaffold585_cov330-Pavlova_lutheri.AAC.10